MTIELRDYQRDAIERVRKQIASGKRSIALAAPTGAGKTVIAGAIILSAYTRNRRVVFFAHRRELIGQTYRKLIDAGIPELAIGVMMGDDRRTRPNAPIQICSIDTWRNREPPPADLVVIDECHRTLSDSYLRAVAHYGGAVILGLSATPYRADRRGLGDVYEALEVVSSPRELSGGKPDLSRVHTRGGDYVERELAAAMN